MVLKRTWIEIVPKLRREYMYIYDRHRKMQPCTDGSLTFHPGSTETLSCEQRRWSAGTLWPSYTLIPYFLPAGLPLLLRVVPPPRLLLPRESQGFVAEKEQIKT